MLTASGCKRLPNKDNIPRIACYLNYKKSQSRSPVYFLPLNDSLFRAYSLSTNTCGDQNSSEVISTSSLEADKINIEVVLHQIFKGNEKMIQYYLENYPNNLNDIIDKLKGDTLLIVVIKHQLDLFVEQLLCMPFVNLNIKNQKGQTAIILAARNKTSRCLKAFLHLLKYRKTPLVALQNILHDFDYSGYNALHCAAYLGNLENVKLLLDAGADATITSQIDEKTALQLAQQGLELCSRKDLENIMRFEEVIKLLR